MASVTALTLSHFRSHKGLSLEFDGRPVAIHGPNGSGKTNLLEAVSLLSPGRGLRRAAPGEIARLPEAVGWRVGARLVGARSEHEVDLRAEAGGPRRTEVDGRPAPQTALGRLARMVWLVPAMDRLWIEGAEGRRRFLDRIALSFEPTHAEATIAYDKAMRERNRLLKDGVTDPGWFAALERTMAQAGAAIQENRAHAVGRLTQAQEEAVTPFPAARLAVEGEGAVGEDALRRAFERGRRDDAYAGRTLAGPHRADLAAVYAAKGVAARQCSTGEQKALLLSMVLANARALAADVGAPPLLLLDEVGAHLDAARREALYAEVVELGAQAWMTGTGPELFAPLGGAARRLAVVDEGGTSRVEDA